MTRENGYVKGLFIGSLFGGIIGAFAASFYASKRGRALRTDSIVLNVKDDNALQINIMEKAGIPEKEIPKYALSSVADGRILRDYINEVKNGEISVDGAIKKVKQDYEKMKSGEKEGKFVTPSNTEQNESRERKRNQPLKKN